MYHNAARERLIKGYAEKIGEDRTSNSRDMLVDRQIATTVTDRNTLLPY